MAQSSLIMWFSKSQSKGTKYWRCMFYDYSKTMSIKPLWWARQYKGRHTCQRLVSFLDFEPHILFLQEQGAMKTQSNVGNERRWLFPQVIKISNIAQALCTGLCTRWWPANMQMMDHFIDSHSVSYDTNEFRVVQKSLRAGEKILTNLWTRHSLLCIAAFCCSASFHSLYSRTITKYWDPILVSSVQKVEYRQQISHARRNSMNDKQPWNSLVWDIAIWSRLVHHL